MNHPIHNLPHGQKHLPVSPPPSDNPTLLVKLRRGWLVSRILTFHFGVAFSTLVRRLVNGPTRPNWPILLELIVAVVKRGAFHTMPSFNLLRQNPVTVILPNTRLEHLFIQHVPATWFIHERAESSKNVILYLHGGGYCICGSNTTHRGMISAIARTSGVKILAIDYRMAPEHQFPAALDDAVMSYRWLLDNGFAPENIMIAGDSAGGGLTAATLLQLRNEKIPLPRAAVLLSPWVDLTGTRPSWKRNYESDYLPKMVGHLEFSLFYAGSQENKLNPLVSPIYADLQGLPPMLIQVGDAEILYDEGVEFAEKAKNAGVSVTLEEYANMVHMFQGFPFLEEAPRALRKIGDFVRSQFQVEQAKL